MKSNSSDKGRNRNAGPRHGGGRSNGGQHHSGSETRVPDSVRLHANERAICGRNCVKEVLKHRCDKILRVVTAIRSDKPAEGVAGEILDLCGKCGVDVSYVPDELLSTLCATESHQGFAAVVRSSSEMQFKDFLDKVSDKAQSTVLLIDSVEDPQNLGSMFRAAECFAVDSLIWSKNRGVGLTPVVSKVSVGGSELVTHCEVSNLVDAMRKLKEKGYWIVAAQMNEDAKPLAEFKFPEKTALLLGAEGEGIRKLALEQADFRVFIPMTGKISSLNVNQATSILLYAIGANKR